MITANGKPQVAQTGDYLFSDLAQKPFHDEDPCIRLPLQMEKVVQEQEAASSNGRWVESEQKGRWDVERGKKIERMSWTRI